MPLIRLTFPWEPEDCQHCSPQSMSRDAWLTEDETLRFFTTLDHSSITMPRWLLWCLFSCFPECPLKVGDWPKWKSLGYIVVMLNDKASIESIPKPGSFIRPNECLGLCLQVLKQLSQKSKSSQLRHLNLEPFIGNIWHPSHLRKV